MLYPPPDSELGYNSGCSELRSTPPYRDRPSEIERKARRNRPYERRVSIKLLCYTPRHDIHTYHRKMLNVGESSPLNLHREALQARLNPSASNSSRSVIGHRSFYSSNKSVTSDDHCTTDLEGGGSHDPHSILPNSSLVSFRTEEASPNRDGHDYDQDPPTVLNIRLASDGVYDSERGRGRGRPGQRIARTYVNIASEDGEGNSRSSAPSHTVCIRTFRLGDLSKRYPRVHLFHGLAHRHYREDDQRLSLKILSPSHGVGKTSSLFQKKKKKKSPQFSTCCSIICNGDAVTLVKAVTMDKLRRLACGQIF